MPESDVTSIMSYAAGLSDDTAVQRLFEITATGGQDSHELAQLDALVYERLTQAYNDAALPAQEQAIRAA